MASGPPEYLSDHVHQATGMICGEVGCDLSEAFDRLCIRAAATGQTLDAAALDVLNRVISFNE